MKASGAGSTRHDCSGIARNVDWRGPGSKTLSEVQGRWGVWGGAWGGEKIVCN